MTDGGFREIVGTKLAEFADRLRADELVGEDELISAADLRLVLTHPVHGNRRAAVVMQEGTEVFVVRLGVGWPYSIFETAYDESDKLEVVDELLDLAESYLRGRFHEKVYEAGSGKELHRELYLLTPDGTPVRWAGSHDFPAAQLRKLMANHSYYLSADGVRESGPPG